MVAPRRSTASAPTKSSWPPSTATPRSTGSSPARSSSSRCWRGAGTPPPGGLRGAGRDAASSDRAMLDEALALRDLLKFEFFFAEKTQFLREAQAELPLIAPTHVSAGGRRLAALGTPPDATSTLLAPRVLRSFLEASWIVAE